MDVGLSFGTMERLSDGKKDILEEARVMLENKLELDLQRFKKVDKLVFREQTKTLYKAVEKIRQILQLELTN